MADPISIHDRALIDDAIAAGRVTQIAAGMTKSASINRRRSAVKEHHEQGWTATAIANHLGVSVATIANDRRALNLSAKHGPRSSGDKAAQKRHQSAARKAAKVRDRRRFKTTPVPLGKPAVQVPASTNGTRFPSRVFDIFPTESVLKDGSNNAKIGGDVLLGHLKGATILTLTLEERATCPKSCAMWRGCYGNSMQEARRWKHGSALEEKLRREIREACETHYKVLVRLHVLGDFYSFEYLCLWAELLDQHDNLHVFGFTAWKANTKIGNGIHKLRSVYPTRFMVRTSDTSGRWGSFTVDFPTEKKTIGDAIVCPEQRYAALPDVESKAKFAGSRGAIHCGNCTACWSSDRPIAFMEH